MSIRKTGGERGEEEGVDRVDEGCADEDEGCDVLVVQCGEP